MRVFALLGVLVLVAGCATRPDIVLDYDKDHDFSRYETFAWMDGQLVTVEGNRQAPEMVLAAAEQAVRTEMREKGFREVRDPADADFGVKVVLGVSQAMVFDSTDRTVYAPTQGAVRTVNRPGPRRDKTVVVASGYEQVSLDPLARMIDEGKVVVQIFDLTSNTAVWSASATKDVTHQRPDGSNADRAFQYLLRDFPPN